MFYENIKIKKLPCDINLPNIKFGSELYLEMIDEKNSIKFEMTYEQMIIRKKELLELMEK